MIFVIFVVMSLKVIFEFTLLSLCPLISSCTRYDTTTKMTKMPRDRTRKGSGDRPRDSGWSRDAASGESTIIWAPMVILKLRPRLTAGRRRGRGHMCAVVRALPCMHPRGRKPDTVTAEDLG